jgi:ectoine hydroxylase-related dioxygenase (phytanoyl-CoA dioxygenase family)
MSAFVEDVLPDEAEVAFYRENGWLLTRLFVRDEHLDACAAAADDVYRGRYDVSHPWSAEKGNAGYGEAYGDRTRPRLDAYVSHHKGAVRAVVQSEPLGAYAAALMGTAQVRLFRDILLTMPAGHATGWHVDKNYWPTCSSERLTSAWFSLSDCGEENGCLVVVSGSHRWPRPRFVRKVRIDDTAALAWLYHRPVEALPVVPVPHRRGQVSFHSCLLLHGSLPNAGAVPRQSFAVVLQDGENRYALPEAQADLRLAGFNTNDRVGPRTRDGLPDYADAAFYPTLYSREGVPS